MKGFSLELRTAWGISVLNNPWNRPSLTDVGTNGLYVFITQVAEPAEDASNREELCLSLDNTPVALQSFTRGSEA